MAFRSGPLARRLLGLLPRTSLAPKPAAPYRLLTVCGAAHLSLFREAMRSAAQSWSALPPLLAVSDGTLTARALQAEVRGWPGDASAIERADVINQATAHREPLLASFARISPFGLKFAALVTSALREPTLYVDSDVLWYGDVPLSDVGAPDGAVQLAATVDFQPAYDSEVAEALGESLFDAPFVNSGVVYMSGDLLEAVDLAAGLRVAARRYNHFAEQTLIAVAVRRLRAPLWAPSTIACFQGDAQSLGVTYRNTGWSARHYVGPVRHLFWRDALALRLGVPK